MRQTGLPPRAGVKVLLEGRQQGLSYDEVREDAPEQIAAVENWIARVSASRRNVSATGKRPVNLVPPGCD